MNLESAISIYANRKLQGKTAFQGLPISVENRKGSVRKGNDPTWGPWQTKMQVPYGYLRGTKGLDGQEIDVFVGSDVNSENAYVITIKKQPDFKEDDEQKVFLGFSTASAAKKSFFQHYDDKRFFSKLETIPMDEFKQLVGTAGKLKIKLEADIGEPGVYDGGYGHIEPLPTYRPPSAKKGKPIPTDSPGETDDTYGDVTQRKSKATKARRDSLTRQHTDANYRALNRQLVSGFPQGTIGGFG